MWRRAPPGKTRRKASRPGGANSIQPAVPLQTPRDFPSHAFANVPDAPPDVFHALPANASQGIVSVNTTSSGVWSRSLVTEASRTARPSAAAISVVRPWAHVTPSLSVKKSNVAVPVAASGKAKSRRVPFDVPDQPAWWIARARRAPVSPTRTSPFMPMPSSSGAAHSVPATAVKANIFHIAGSLDD